MSSKIDTADKTSVHDERWLIDALLDEARSKFSDIESEIDELIEARKGIDTREANTQIRLREARHEVAILEALEERLGKVEE